MKKIIHLSDLHVGYKHCEAEFGKIVDHIVATYTPSEYVVVVTGDIVDNAKVEGSYDFAKKYLSILENAGFLLLVVPGNHDYGTGSKGYKKFVKLFKLAFYGDANVSYPKIDIVEGIAFIGLDSMAETFDWLDMWGADGELGNKQLNRLAKMLASPELVGLKKVVYLHHHPFDGRGLFHMLKDHRQFEAIISNKVDCLLFGHNHDGHAYLDNELGIAFCYDGSSSTGKSKEIGKAATPVRVISLQ